MALAPYYLGDTSALARVGDDRPTGRHQSSRGGCRRVRWFAGAAGTRQIPGRSGRTSQRRPATPKGTSPSPGGTRAGQALRRRLRRRRSVRAVRSRWPTPTHRRHRRRSAHRLGTTGSPTSPQKATPTGKSPRHCMWPPKRLRSISPVSTGNWASAPATVSCRTRHPLDDMSPRSLGGSHKGFPDVRPLPRPDTEVWRRSVWR